MPENNPVYTKLPFTGRHPAAFALSNRKGEIWMAHDHLLVIEAGAYSEQAKRIYFDDIQTITITPTPTARKVGTWLSAVGFVLILISILGILIYPSLDRPSRDTVFQEVGLSFLVAVCGIISFVMLWLGITRLLAMPSCNCVVHTATQAHPVLALSSLRKAEKFVAFIRPYLDSTQGAIPEERFEQATEPTLVRPAIATKLGRTSKGDAPKPPLKPLFHWMLFLIQIPGSINGVTMFFIPGTIQQNISMFIMAVQLVAIIGALVSQARSRCPRELTVLTWALVVSIGILFTTWTFISAFLQSFNPGTEFDVAVLMGYPAYQGLLVADILICTALGVLGIMRLARGVNMPAPEPPPMAASVAPPPLPPRGETLSPDAETLP
jgi:hypothetical protein